MGYFLAAADLAFPGALRAVGSRQSSDLLVAAYNHSAGRVAEILIGLGHSWGGAAAFDGPWKDYHLRCRTGGDRGGSPWNFDRLELADYLDLKNYEMERHRREGIGAAMIAYREGTPERREANPFLSPIGMTSPVNAVLDFRRGGDGAELKISDVMLEEQIVIRGRKLPMAADLTASLAVELEYDVDRRNAFKAMTHPDKYVDHAGLYLLEPYRPDQIPVIFVHGLMSKPEIWVEAINRLRADPLLVRKYQLLVYRYPTGYPVIYNMASLRKQLAAFKKYYDPSDRNPRMREMILVGHSMGSVLSNSMVRNSGDAFTGLLFDRPIEELADLDDQQKAVITDLLIFDSNPDVTRAVLLAGPFRGSGLATGAMGALGRRLINLPGGLLDALPSGELAGIEGLTDEGRLLLKQRPDSIGSLKPDAPGLFSILENPIRKGVTVHTIIGHHDPSQHLEEGGDGTVPYKSAHLDEAVSEKIVHAKHSPLCKHPDTLEELRRILYLHAGLGSPRRVNRSRP